MDEPIICSECLAEIESTAIADEAGWRQHEFGWHCPGCLERSAFQQQLLVSDGFDPDEASASAPPFPLAGPDQVEEE